MRSARFFSFFLTISFLLTTNLLLADVRLPRFFSDGVVLQRNRPIPIWGWADAGEAIQVQFMGKRYDTKAGLDGKWKLQLSEAAAGGPHVLICSGRNEVRIGNILIGDVWICSGQSNMEYELYRSGELYPKEIAGSANDRIRHFKVARNLSFSPSDDVGSEKGWQSASPNTVPEFTAVGYFFAQQLYEKYGIPIGLVNCSYGGTPAEGWMHEDELKDLPVHYERAMKYKDTALVASIVQRDKKLTEDWNARILSMDQGTQQKWESPSTDLAGWERISVPGYWQEQGLRNGGGAIVWYAKEIWLSDRHTGKDARLRLGHISMRDITYVNGKKVGSISNRYFPRNYELPAGLLKPGRNLIMVRVLNESGEGGFIPGKTYRLETGDTVLSLEGDWKFKQAASIPPLTRDQLTRMQDQPTSLYHGMLEPLIGMGIKGVIWYQGESNINRAKEYQIIFSRLITSWRRSWGQGDFPFLYCQLASNNPVRKDPYDSRLAELQEAQTKTLSVPNTAMAVLHDVGEWNDVHPVNKLDVGKRLALAARRLAYGDDKVVHSGPLFSSVDAKGRRLVIRFTHIGSGLMAKGGGELKHFAVSADGKKFIWANARIKGDKVLVWSDAVAKPVAVRYAWADTPEGANLYNREGLPASSFRAELK